MSSAQNRVLFDPNQKQRAETCNANGLLTPIELCVKKVKELGNVQSSTTFVKRDLGFQGQIGSYVLLTYGDTMFSDSEDSDKWRGMSCNSVALATANPTIVFDPVLDENSFPKCFLPPSCAYSEDLSTHSLGLSNVIETSPGQGIAFFLLNYRPDGSNHLLGAGVAEIHLDHSADPPTPIANRLCRYMWDAANEPWFGDVCALKSGEWIYAYGHKKDNPWVYLARCTIDSVTEVDAYEYWDGKNWTKERARGAEWDERQSIFWQVNQGQIFWSKHHHRFIFIYCDNWWSCQVLAKTSVAPEGPWSDPITIHKAKPIQKDGNIYAAIPHPYFDNTGRSLIITYTNHPNTVQAIRVADFQVGEETDQGLLSVRKQYREFLAERCSMRNLHRECETIARWTMALLRYHDLNPHDAEQEFVASFIKQQWIPKAV